MPPIFVVLVQEFFLCEQSALELRLYWVSLQDMIYIQQSKMQFTVRAVWWSKGVKSALVLTLL